MRLRYVLAPASLALTTALICAAPASAATAHPAPPVLHLVAGPDVGGVNYNIYSDDFSVGSFITDVGSGNRVVLGSGDGNTQFNEQATYYSYGGLKWYQWKNVNDGLCLQTSSDGAAHLVMATCNTGNEEQFFYNSALSGSKILSLESSVFEGTDYGCWAENSTALAVNAFVNNNKFKWTFQVA